MKITFLCSDPNHSVNSYLRDWIAKNAGAYVIDLIHQKAQLTKGTILFLISCMELVTSAERDKYEVCLVLHASDLPKGRGWSPHIWEIVRGAEMITLSLLEAEDKLDSGRIWKKKHIKVPKHALWNEINHLLFSAEIELINFAVEYFSKIKPIEQLDCEEVSYYPRRTPQDSELDLNKTILEQFDLIRVCDPQRFPAYFFYMGHRYIVKMEKSDE